MSGNFVLLFLILWPFAGSLIIFLSGNNKKRTDQHALTIVSAEVILALGAIWMALGSMHLTDFHVPYIEGFGLNFKLDGFRVAYLLVSVIMWFCSTAISGEYFGEENNNVRYYCLSMWTFAATIGVFISADMLTTFTFFEIMSLASYAYVAHTEKKDAMRAAETYLAVAVIGGLVMLMGMLLLHNMTGTLDYMTLKDKCAAILKGSDTSNTGKLYAAGFCMLFGFGAKAGMFPLHIWLPKAHPVAPAPASALLSGVLTKCGVFGVLVLTMEIFAEEFTFGIVIVLLGVVTMLTGAVLAVFSINLKRTLACSSVSQIGFILIGAGLVPLLKEECTLALSGTMLYMVNHSLFKLTLFLAAAAIYMKCHMLDINDLRGYGKDMPLLKVLFIIGALGISGVPLLSGYVSKTLIHEGLVEYIHEAGRLSGLFKTIEILFLFSGGMTFAYMMKIFHAVFVDEPEKECKYAGKDKNISALSYVSIAIPAALIVVLGIFPKMFINGLAVLMGRFNSFKYDPEQLEILAELKIFSLENLKGSMISLGIGTGLFILIRLFLAEGNRLKAPEYPDRWPKKLDLEELVYRPVLCRFFPFVFRHLYVDAVLKGIWSFTMFIGKNTGRLLANFFDRFLTFLRIHVFSELTEQKHPRIDRLKKDYIKAEVNYKILSGALSFSMMLICLGLCGTLFYLLYLMVR